MNKIEKQFLFACIYMNTAHACVYFSCICMISACSIENQNLEILCQVCNFSILSTFLPSYVCNLSHPYWSVGRHLYKRSLTLTLKR